jgi:hypothetical protein
MSLFGSDERVVKKLDDLKDLLTEPSEKKGLSDKILGLKKQVVELEIQRDKKQEEFDRRDRELTHMIGLEKKRQEVETKQAVTAAGLSVREENLKADKDRFDKEMKFREERFTEEVGYLKGMVAQILERLPTVNVDRQIKGAGK